MKPHYPVAMATLLLLLLSLSPACDRKEAQVSQPTFKNEILLVGSSTMAPTISQLADQFKNEYLTWNRVDGSLPAEKIQISVATGGSGAGARAVLDGTANFGMLARAARESERNALADYREFQVGIDALLIATPKDHPLAQKRVDLTSEEVRRLFSGEITHWHELDAELPAEEVVLMVRDVGGGAHSVFQNAVMGQVDVSNRAVQVPTMASLVPRLIGNRQAIGYASYVVAEAHQGQLFTFTLDGVEPSPENIINGSYPVSRPLLLIWDGELSATEQAFLDYVRSEAGVRVIKEMGFLPTL